MSSTPNKQQASATVTLGTTKPMAHEPNLYVPPEPPKAHVAPAKLPRDALPGHDGVPAETARVNTVARPVTPNDSASIVVPVSYDATYAAVPINGRFTGIEASMLKAIRSGLVKKGARLLNGQVVDDHIGTVRWMLQQAAKQLPPPESHGI